MTQLTALKELAEKVEAGDIHDTGFANFMALSGGEGVYIDRQAATASRAHFGSLDAAKALHEAVLPGWTWGIGPLGAGVDYDCEVNGWTVEIHEDNAKNPARAWLLAVIRAKIQELEA